MEITCAELILEVDTAWSSLVLESVLPTSNWLSEVFFKELRLFMEIKLSGLRAKVGLGVILAFPSLCFNLSHGNWSRLYIHSLFWVASVLFIKWVWTHNLSMRSSKSRGRIPVWKTCSVDLWTAFYIPFLFRSTPKKCLLRPLVKSELGVPTVDGNRRRSGPLAGLFRNTAVVHSVGVVHGASITDTAGTLGVVGNWASSDKLRFSTLNFMWFVIAAGIALKTSKATFESDVLRLLYWGWWSLLVDSCFMTAQSTRSGSISERFKIDRSSPPGASLKFNIQCKPSFSIQILYRVPSRYGLNSTTGKTTLRKLLCARR